MSGRGRRHRNKNQAASGTASGSVLKANAPYTIAADSPILAVFLQAGRQLTERQDRHERLVKLSRDTTIESKRIIFLLHSAVTTEKTKKVIISEAKQRIENLVNDPIRAMAFELENVPEHLHSKAVTAGLQEFIEARTLLSLMENKHIITFPQVRNELTYTVKVEGQEDRTVAMQLPHLDYMLGLADLTGELMRKAINSIPSGNSNECLFSCQVVRQLYGGFLGLFRAGPLLTTKLSTTRANVHKVEYALYALRVRGGEAPGSLLLPAAPQAWDPQTAPETDGDEGFY